MPFFISRVEPGIHQSERNTYADRSDNDRECIVVEPIMRVEGIFNQQGRLKIWLTDDQRKMPVLMKSKVLIGSIDARLRKIRKLKT